MKTKKFAILSNQGTAIDETVLTEEEHNDWKIKIKTEIYAEGLRDCSNPLVWADVTGNEAFD